MTPLKWHGQSPLAKWFAVTSTIVVAGRAFFAGAAFLGAEQNLIAYERKAPRAYEWIASLGLFSIIGAWVLHMASMLLLLGYRHTGNRIAGSLVMTGFATLFLFFTASISLSVFWPCGTKSLM